MALKKLTLDSFIPTCLKPKTTSSSSSAVSKTHISKQVSQRLSLTDVSNPGSPISAIDLSNSLVGSHLVIFTLSELMVVTRNFSKSNYIGEGGFGMVYKGVVDDKVRTDLKTQDVAVKMLDLDGTQGHREWLTEVIFLGQLKHPHLVNLIGYCCEDEHRLLVYEYVANGNLDDQLFRKYSATLPWLTRIKIAIGAAKGLAFLHEDEKPIIYRDFKASNVLLDSDYNARLSDFGLATDGPRGDDTHVTTRVMGTRGYAAPEYISTGHLTTMSDVYGFGVVLLELLTGRRAVDKNRPSREQDLVEWARPMLKDTQKLDKIMDSRLEGRYSHEGAKRAALLAHQCLSHSPKFRPNMLAVVKTLEVVMDFDDVPVGPFVYIVPNECTDLNTKKFENGDDCNVPLNGMDIQEKEGEKREKSRRPRRKGHRHRHRIRSTRSRAVFSDTNLYQKIGTSLYSFNHQKQILPDDGKKLES